MERFVDGEERQRIALDAMEAMEDLLASADDHVVRMQALGALVSLVFDANRRALPIANTIVGSAND